MLAALPIARKIDLSEPHLVLDYNELRCANAVSLKLGINTVSTTELDAGNKNVGAHARVYHFFKLEGTRKKTSSLGTKRAYKKKPQAVVPVLATVLVKKSRHRHCGAPTIKVL